MATLYTNLASQQLPSAPGSTNRSSTLEATPKNRTLTPFYTMTGAEAASDTIRIAKVPAGVIVLPTLSSTATRAGGLATTMTITVGDDGGGSNDGAVTLDVDRYSTALNVAAAGADAFTGGIAAEAPFTTTAETWITATIATLATPTAGGILQFFITLKQGN